MTWTPVFSAVPAARLSARGQDGDAGGDRRAQGEARTAHVQQHAMPRIDHVDAGAFHQSELAESTRFVLATAERHHRRRGTCHTIAKPAGKRRCWRTLTERGYNRKGDWCHR
jgi:hypothetical protein